MMVLWNKDLGVFIQTLLMIITLISLIVFRRNLGKNINYFIYAIALGCCIEVVNFLSRLSNNDYDTVPVYVVGVNLGVFLLFFLYFHNVLEVKKFRQISMILMGTFLLSYICFATMSEHFFDRFPFVFYCLEVSLLAMSIFLVLWQTFNSDRILNLRSYYPFWICIGLMVIYLGVAPLLIVSKTASQMMNLNIFFIILFAVNVLGYSILLTGIFYAKNVQT